MTFPIDETPRPTIHPLQAHPTLFPRPSFKAGCFLLSPHPTCLDLPLQGNFLHDNVWSPLPGAALLLLAPNENVTVFNPPQSQISRRGPKWV